MMFPTHFISSSISIDPRVLISQTPLLRDDDPLVADPHQAGITALFFLTSLVVVILVGVCYIYLSRIQDQLMKYRCRTSIHISCFWLWSPLNHLLQWPFQFQDMKRTNMGVLLFQPPPTPSLVPPIVRLLHRTTSLLASDPLFAIFAGKVDSFLHGEGLVNIFSCVWLLCFGVLLLLHSCTQSFPISLKNSGGCRVRLRALSA